MLHLFSIFLEVVIVCVALAIAVTRRRYYGYGLALTFGLYVFYDLAKQYSWNLPGQALNWVFLVATVSALFSLLRLLVKP
jgi:hypothetical protein